MSHPAPGDARVSVTPILQKVPLFGQLSPAELDRVAEITRERSYPRNSVILFEDDPGDALYVVAKGQVKVVLIGEDGREDRKSTRLNSSHLVISYAVFCLK